MAVDRRPSRSGARERGLDRLRREQEREPPPDAPTEFAIGLDEDDKSAHVDEADDVDSYRIYRDGFTVG